MISAVVVIGYVLLVSVLLGVLGIIPSRMKGTVD
jgi:hypothetical protein